MVNDGDIIFSFVMLAVFIVLIAIWFFLKDIKEWWRKRRERRRNL